MSSLTNNRKFEHISILNADEEIDRRKYYFDAIRLKHRAMPEIDLADVDPSTEFLGKRLSFPLLISSMTGGDHDVVRKINRNLAIAAEEAGVAMGVGSQRVMFSNPKARSSFDIRPHAPNALLLSNLGAVQLNYGFELRHCREAIEVVRADGLYFHLNPLQEAIQPEGDTNFAGLIEKIGAVAGQLDKPVILKEVGAGLSLEDVKLGVDHGIQYFDVAGSGGTSWSRIEHHRQAEADRDDLGLLFQDWGNPTPWILRQLRPLRNRIKIIASGGIRTGIDMVKSIILGAELCGLAKPFLQPAMESPQAVLHVIHRLKREFTVAMFLMGVKKFEELHDNESLIAEMKA